MLKCRGFPVNPKPYFIIKCADCCFLSKIFKSAHKTLILAKQKQYGKKKKLQTVHGVSLSGDHVHCFCVEMFHESNEISLLHKNNSLGSPNKDIPLNASC